MQHLFYSFCYCHTLLIVGLTQRMKNEYSSTFSLYEYHRILHSVSAVNCLCTCNTNYKLYDVYFMDRQSTLLSLIEEMNSSCIAKQKPEYTVQTNDQYEKDDILLRYRSSVRRLLNPPPAELLYGPWGQCGLSGMER